MGLFSDWVDEHIRPDETPMTANLEFDVFAESAGGETFAAPMFDEVFNLTTERGDDLIIGVAAVGAGVAYPDWNRDWDWGADYDFNIEGADIIVHAEAHHRVLQTGGEPNLSGRATIGVVTALDFKDIDLADNPIEIHLPLLTPYAYSAFHSFRYFFLAELDLL